MREFHIKPGQVVIWKGRSFGPRQERMLIEDGFDDRSLNQAIGETVDLGSRPDPSAEITEAPTDQGSPEREAAIEEAREPPPAETPAEVETPKPKNPKTRK